MLEKGDDSKGLRGLRGGHEEARVEAFDNLGEISDTVKKKGTSELYETSFKSCKVFNTKIKCIDYERSVYQN